MIKKKEKNETTAAQFNSKLKANIIPGFIPHKTTLSFTHHPAIKRPLALVEQGPVDSPGRPPKVMAGGDRKRGGRRCMSSRDDGTLEKTTGGLRTSNLP